LARKYAGQKNDHIRMMDPPIAVEDLPAPDVVLVTHAHTDHMDPDTLGPLYKRFPQTEFVVPRGALETAHTRIHQDARIRAVDADEDHSVSSGLRLRVFPAAHETLLRTEEGYHVFLGYGIDANGLKIYHSGDSIPFEGLARRIDDFAPDIALMPVNGRDAERLADGIPGNFTLQEAISLTRSVPILIPHHFGMFAFNTIDPSEIDHAAAATNTPKIVRPTLGASLRIAKPTA
jgi:L-ascorbate metabolism protein UlaG (beta-lactamase superfamily)